MTIVEKNESIRKQLAGKVLGVYHVTSRDMAQISNDLNNTLTLTQVPRNVLYVYACARARVIYVF